MGYSFQLTARVLLYLPSHRQDSTHHSLCYTSWLEREISTVSDIDPHQLTIGFSQKYSNVDIAINKNVLSTSLNK